MRIISEFGNFFEISSFKAIKNNEFYDFYQILIAKKTPMTENIKQ
jgi:hypothetical protein